MRFGGVIMAITLGLALAGAAGAAQAQSAQGQSAQGQAAQRRAPAPQTSLTDAARAQDRAAAAPAPRRGLRWYDPGRWGLSFNLNQPVGREADWGDVEAGAYYQLNRRLSVGAAADLGTREIDPARAPETDRRGQPRVRLETIFKF